MDSRKRPKEREGGDIGGAEDGNEADLTRAEILRLLFS